MPVVTYQWFINATAYNTTIMGMIPADRARYIVSNNMLTITGVLVKDAGMYQCAASNTHGMTYSTAQLRALGKRC